MQCHMDLILSARSAVLTDLRILLISALPPLHSSHHTHMRKGGSVINCHYPRAATKLSSHFTNVHIGILLGVPK